MKSYELFLDEDGVPWASPEIQKDYEAALGRFIVAFNAIDNLLTQVIEIVLTKLSRVDLVKLCTEVNYAQKLLTLDLLKQSSEGRSIADMPVVLMREVGAHRNKVAHGHFEQDPHSGEYEIVARASRKYSAEDLDALTVKATTACHALRFCEVYYAFVEVSVPSYETRYGVGSRDFAEAGARTAGWKPVEHRCQWAWDRRLFLRGHLV